MNNDYPALASMGVQNPLQITGYTLTQPQPDTDILKIKYVRPKGSFLPVTRSYTLGRSLKTYFPEAGGAHGYAEQVYEISPVLSRAIEELDSIVQGKQSRKELQQQILQEMERMQAELNAEIAALRQMVNRLAETAE